MIKIITITGTRPQIIKSAALSREIKKNFSDKFEEVIIHTGQHYDNQLSAVFYKELELPEPSYYLNIGSHLHGKQTGLMIEKIEEILLQENPELVVLYGDTNTTLSGALAASKLRIPVAHIEAGLRSFNKKMPEEINRIVCDHTSTLLFAPTNRAVENLKSEGFIIDKHPPYAIDNPGVFNSGDIMLDNTLHFSKTAERKSKILESNGLEPNNFILLTIHRDHNTDDTENLKNIFSALIDITEKHRIPVFFPVHPRTLKMMHQHRDKNLINRIRSEPLIRFHDPVSFFDIIMLEKNARIVMTDSGGIQKESYFFRKPVIVLRNETEWVEIIENDAGILAGANPDKIIAAYNELLVTPNRIYPGVFGDGQAAKMIIETIQNFAEGSKNTFPSA